MIKITFRQLEILESVVRSGSFLRAAEDLHLTQPAVSMQIKQLENILGVSVFEQMGKQMHLTEAGREVLRTSQAVHRELVNLEHTLASLQDLKGGMLTVSASSTASYFTARMIATFRDQYPDVRVSLNVVNTETVLKHLAENSVDLAILGEVESGHDLLFKHIMDNPYVVITAPNHPLAEQRKITLSKLMTEPFVGREQGSGTREIIEKFFSEKGLTLRAAMIMNKNEAIKQAVEAGLGLSIVSLYTIQTELAAKILCVLDVEGFPLNSQWYLVQREGKRLSPAATAFSNFVQEYVDRYANPILSHKDK